MKRMFLTCLAAALPVLPLFGQAIDYKFLDGLAQKAKESSVVDLGPEQLALLSSMTGKSISPEALKGLKGIQVRSYEFDKAGMYDMDQIRAFRDRLKASGNWVNLISTKEGNKEFTDIMINKGADGNAAGLFIIAAEQNELSIVHIDGVADLKALGALGGLGGIPHLGDVKPGREGGSKKNGDTEKK